MEFEGTVWSVLPVVKGTSARGEWVKQEVVFEQPGEFSRKVCVSFWGDRAQEAGALQKGVAHRPQGRAAAGSGFGRTAAAGRFRARRRGALVRCGRSGRSAVLIGSFRETQGEDFYFG